MRVTEKQGEVLEVLADYARPVTARQLADKMERPGARRARYSSHEVRGHLLRLCVKGLVRRQDSEGRVLWSVTQPGRARLEVLRLTGK